MTLTKAIDAARECVQGCKDKEVGHCSYWKPDCGCRFMYCNSSAVQVCEECSKLPYFSGDKK